MASKALIYDLTSLDMNRVVADIDEIRKYNPQRFEMEQLTGIIHEDTERHFCVAFKDTSHDDFWARGHMPGIPLMPGVIMLEAVAQMCSYYTQKYDLLDSDMVGFGGLEDVRFRDPVLPGDRLILICELLKVRRGRMIVCRFQGVVQESVAVEGVLKGVPIPVEALKRLTDQ